MHQLRVDKTGVHLDGHRVAATEVFLRYDPYQAWAQITIPADVDVDVAADVTVAHAGEAIGGSR